MDDKHFHKDQIEIPQHPDKINYSVHAYVKGENTNEIYYYDGIKVINLLPSIGLQKSVTEETVLIDRKDVESIYPPSIRMKSPAGFKTGIFL